MDYCTCGSIIINGNCTNKNCGNMENKTSQAKARKTTKAKAAAAPAAAKSTKVPRASKCITYKIGELPPNSNQ
jgi:hypothetical protein